MKDMVTIFPKLGRLSLIFIVLMMSVAGFGQTTYDYIFTSTIYNANNQTKTLNGVDWELVNLVNNGGYYGSHVTKGQQVGSGSRPAKNMTLTTTGISGIITKVIIETSGASSVSANVLASVNGIAYGTAQTITASNTAYTFVGSSSGDIELKWVQTSSKALYIKRITIEYVVSSAPTLSNQTFSNPVGVPFSETPTNSGAAATSWSITSGTLPTGLSLNSSTGEISGTPTNIETTTVEITATNAGGSSTATYTIHINDLPCFSEDFSDITTGDNTTTGGSGSAWGGNANFPTVVKAHLAGGAVKLGTSSNDGSIESQSLSSVSGLITVEIDVKGWTTVEGNLKVSIGGQSQTLAYSAKMADAFETVTTTFSNVPTSSKLKIETTSKRAFIDGVRIYCAPQPVCAPTLTVSEIRPEKAPANSFVQVEVNDASLIDHIELEGTNISYTTLNATTIELQIPSTMTKGNKSLTLYESSGCDVDETIEVVESSGNCTAIPSTYNDLFISEVYDSGTGNEWYMELYNPTNTAIVLNSVYSIERRGSVGGAVTRTINLTGTVAPFSVFTLLLGSDGTNPITCNGISYNFTEKGGGINDNDQIDLVKNNVVVDVVYTPNYSGYSLYRKVLSGQTVPTTTYTAVQWDINSTEDCSDLGNFNIDNSTNTVTVTDNSTCQIDLTATSTASGVTYQWYYNDPSSMTDWKKVNSTNLSGVTISGETADHLVISGNTNSLDGYQFYAASIDGSCESFSNASQYQFGVVAYYRSKANGNWTDVANWEISNDMTTWLPACDYPRANNSEKVFIESNTDINLDIDNDVNYIEIKSDATLEIEPNSKFTIFNENSGADLVVDGTLYYRSNTANTLTLDNSATWILGANATLIKTNTGGATQLRDKYEGGISTIPASAQWTYRYNGDGNPTTVSINMYYPNLRFENTTGAMYALNSSSVFNGNSTNIIIKGNLEIGTTGTAPYEMYNNNFNASPIVVMGDLTIGAGSILLNESVSNATAIGDGTGIELQGNLIVDGTLDLTVNSNTSSAARILKFSGTGNQTVSGSGVIAVYKIEVNKPSGDVILNRNLQAQGDLTMMKGNIITGTNQLELGWNTAQKGTLNYTDGFVVGKMKRWFDGANSGDASGLFPMGWDDLGLKNRFAKIEFTSAPVGGSLTTVFVPQDMGYLGLGILAANSGGFGSDVTNAENQGYWTIAAGDGLSGGTYKASLTGEGFSEVVNLADLTELKRDNASSPWTTPGNHIAASGTLTKPTVSRSGLTGFSDFGFGSRNSEHPLPIELLSFTADCEAGQTILRWETATETNNDRFILEISEDLSTWTLLDEVRGAGNSQIANQYQFIFSNSIAPTLYYRLSQIDFDGAITVYNPLSSSCVNSEKSITIFPVPANDVISVALNGFNSHHSTVSIFNLEGRLMNNFQWNTGDGNSLQIDVRKLSKGIYFMQLETEDGEITTEKFEIQ